MDAVEEIKARLSIEDVVSQYVELKRSGRNFKALSPFTNEKTASLMVSPEKQIWHDFSSGKGGDMFSFVMEVEGLDFKAALEQLARQAGVDLEQFRGRQSGTGSKQKERLLAALELAAKFYQLHLSKSKPTLEYVIKQRQFTKPTILTFRLGYAPRQDKALTTFLLKKGFSQAELKQSGLSTQRRGGLSDMFRGRLMVPLMDQSGRVVGFTARQLDDDPNAPKYINTPASPVYDKSRHVFGLHLAKEAIRKQNFSVVAEGNLDVIASHQAGVTNVVATAGTAVTEYHLKTLGRFSPDVRLAFDQDRAGLAAAERAIPIAGKVDVHLSIVAVPEGKDPDELIKKDPAAWRQVVQQPQDPVAWLTAHYRSQLDLATATGKRQLSDRILKVVQSVKDAVEREHYLAELARELGVSQEALLAKLKTTQSKVRYRPVKPTRPPDRQLQESIKLQNHLLALALRLPSLREYIYVITPEMLVEEPAQKLLNFLKANPDFNPEDGEGILPELKDYGKILSLLYEELYQHLEVVELRYEAARLQIRLIETYVKMQKAKLAEQMQRANETATSQLLEKAKELDILLKSTKENA
jgi:DNA primase